ncbi:TetR/AcrR family transcriptional regulator [Pseudonocardia sp. 73-21]|uniref:TetR/AcrR family transcriptional regulator n=2 Tax=unclassified Pseudonocardia TaxID=2619320 RepID=UPI00261BF798|nr:TetR/AcrR family transcriptional regulator [Pseudonocardia sp. 73-21]
MVRTGAAGVPGADRRDRRVATRRHMILTAAATSMAEHGYERVTLEQIGEQVGLSATGLYHYVGGKEDILAQLMTDTIAEIGRETDVLAAGSTDPEVLLRAFVRAHLRVAVTTPAGRVLSNHQDIVVSETYSDVIRDARRRHERRLESILADGAAAQAFRAPDPRTTARFVLGALNGVPRWAGPQATAAATDKIGDQLVDHLISGIGVGASPPGSR